MKKPHQPSDPPVNPLTREQLIRKCDPVSLGFETTDELPDLESFIGQPRAYRALEIGSEVMGKGFNIFVMGLPASGRTTFSREYLERAAAKLPVPNDWVYVNNFSNLHAPKALSLPAGKGTQLKKQIQELVGQSALQIRAAFESDEFKVEQKRIIDTLNLFKEQSLNHLKAFAEKYNFLIARTSVGFVLVPAIEGQPIKPEDIEKLEPEKIEKLKKLEVRIGKEIQSTLHLIRGKERETHDKLLRLNRMTALFVLEHLVDDLQETYQDLPAVCEHLESIQDDMIENIQMFREDESGEGMAQLGQISRQSLLDRYDVNVFVDHTERTGAPVIVESQPTYQNLIGRIEHEMVMGASRTDFTMIRPGALHQANGGFLILPIRDVLLNAYAWEGLKRSLRDGAVRIVELANQLGLMSTATLEPEPIPLNVKVVLVGTPVLYYLLREYDEDFHKIFKIRAEFTTQIERTPDTEREYALFVKSVVLENHLLPFDKTAVARIVEYGSRLVGSQQKLSTRFGEIANLVREADYWTRKYGNGKVGAKEVNRAIAENIYRSSLIEEEIQELIDRNTLMISTSGMQTGQINALSVLSLGDYEFGKPNRVTAVVVPGKAGVVDIESKAELGGPIHTKGMLILSGLLAGRYGRKKPLSLSASITFEQSYTGVEGDSASAAEFIVLVSALAKTPIRQDLAITGSVNQHGIIQPIGGVNQKIEGFFATCKAKGLTGSQGVVIPQANIQNLMLNEDVMQAVAEGNFHIWAMETIDQGLALFSGLAVGVLDEQGNYPDDSLNGQVMRALAAFEEATRSSEKEETDGKA